MRCFPRARNKAFAISLITVSRPISVFFDAHSSDCDDTNEFDGFVGDALNLRMQQLPTVRVNAETMAQLEATANAERRREEKEAERAVQRATERKVERRKSLAGLSAEDAMAMMAMAVAQAESSKMDFLETPNLPPRKVLFLITCAVQEIASIYSRVFYFSLRVCHCSAGAPLSPRTSSRAAARMSQALQVLSLQVAPPWRRILQQLPRQQRALRRFSARRRSPPSRAT